jgi:hypothetical protein
MGRVCVGLPEVELRGHNLQKLEATRLQKFVPAFLASTKKYITPVYYFQTAIFNFWFLLSKVKI